MKNDVIDLFDEEINRREKNIDKKVNKMRIKEEKKKEKERKKFEKKEDQEFDEYLRKMKSSKMNDDIIDIKSVERKLFETDDNTNYEKHHVSTVIIAILSICLFVLGADFVLYNAILNYKDLNTLINNIILIVTIIFYLLSLVIKKDGVKRTFQVLSLLMFIVFIGYQLFIA